METTVKISLSVTGESSGKPFNGDFVVKTLITRKEVFIADERRRLLIGANPGAVPPTLNGEAYMLGQLFVRVVSGPSWWDDSDAGSNLEDQNVIGEIFKATMEKEEERLASLKQTAEKALEKMSKTKKASAE